MFLYIFSLLFHRRSYRICVSFPGIIRKMETDNLLPAILEDVGNESDRHYDLFHRSTEIDLVIRLFLILLDPAGAGFRQKFSKHHQNAIIAFDFPKKKR